MRLSEAQKFCMKYPLVSKISYNPYCENDEFNRISTLNALVKKGLLCFTGRFWLTEKGKAVSKKLNEIPCHNCNNPTHEKEAACLYCGTLKDWATMELEI